METRETLDGELAALEGENPQRYEELMLQLQVQAEELLQGPASPLLGRLFEEQRQFAMRVAIGSTSTGEETWMARGTVRALDKILESLQLYSSFVSDTVEKKENEDGM